MVRAGRQMVMWGVEKCSASPMTIMWAGWEMVVRGVKEGPGRAEHPGRMQGKCRCCSGREAIA